MKDPQQMSMTKEQPGRRCLLKARLLCLGQNVLGTEQMKAESFRNICANDLSSHYEA